MTRHVVQFSLGLAITFLFLWLIVRHVDTAEMWVALSEAKIGWLALGVLMFFLGYFTRVRRWQLMLRLQNPGLSWTRVFAPFLASIAVNNLVPFRAGDVMRAFGFTTWLQQPAASVLATLLVERLLDLLTLMLALGFALLWFGFAADTADTLFGIGAGGLIAIGLTVMAVLLMPRLLMPLVFGVVRLIEQISPSIGLRAEGFANRVFNSLTQLAKARRMGALVVLSFVAWGFEALVFYCVALGVPSLADATAAFLALSVGTLSTLLPSTPGYVGTFDFFVIQAMQMLDNPAAAAAAFAVLVHVVLWLPATLVGLSCLIYLHLQGGISLRNIEKTR